MRRLDQNGDTPCLPYSVDIDDHGDLASSGSPNSGVAKRETVFTIGSNCVSREWSQMGKGLGCGTAEVLRREIGLGFTTGRLKWTGIRDVAEARAVPLRECGWHRYLTVVRTCKGYLFPSGALMRRLAYNSTTCRYCVFGSKVDEERRRISDTDIPVPFGVFHWSDAVYSARYPPRAYRNDGRLLLKELHHR